MSIPPELDPAERILMGPGPSSVPHRILRALSAPTLGHLDPQYIGYMDETCAMLREVFQTKNALTFPVSGTGMAGMEAIASNLIEPGDEAIVCINGLTIVHAETSTGAHQALPEISQIVHDAGMLFVVDAVTSLGGHELRVDDWQIDAIFSGTQKCLSCPPGLSPVSFSDAALEVMSARKSKVQSWYLDVSMLRNYYTGSGGRAYHHTAPINMVYALREALRIVLEEGLEARWERHRRMHGRLREGLEALGLCYIPPQSLHTLNCVAVPEGIDEAAVRKQLLAEYSIEIGAGLGVFAGKAWRIGLMGHAATTRNIDTLLAALGHCLK